MSTRTGIQYLRKLVRFYEAESCPEPWIERFSVSALMRLYDIHRASDFDVPPWRWTSAQIGDALRLGDIPNWDDDLKPIPSVERLEEE